MTTDFDHGGTVFATARRLGVAPEELLDFSASINPLGPVPGVREALAAAFDRLVHYPDSGAAGLVAALAGGHGLAPSQVCVANGSTELIYLLPRLVPGQRGLIIAPPFSEYGRSLVRAGWEVDYLALTPDSGFALCPKALARQLTRGYGLLFLGNPGNPTGRLYGREEVARVLALCRESGTFLVLDEAFMDFCEAESAKELVVTRGGGIVLRSMTKFYAIPGLRLGYAMGAAETIARVAALRQPWSVNTLAQVAGVVSLADATYARRTREYVAAERQWLTTVLGELPGLRVYPAAANYLLLEGARLPATAVAACLEAQGILIRVCGAFSGLNERFFRVAVRSRLENERLRQALAGVFF
jgi:threonine-phosphate decarboxylase